MYQMNLIIYLSSINIIGLLVMFIDKKCAINNKWRISEKTLLFISLIGGCFGIGLGMNLFRHKTKKLKFKLVYLICLIYIFLYIYLKCLL